MNTFETLNEEEKLTLVHSLLKNREENKEKARMKQETRKITRAISHLLEESYRNVIKNAGYDEQKRWLNTVCAEIDYLFTEGEKLREEYTLDESRICSITQSQLNQFVDYIVEPQKIIEQILHGKYPIDQELSTQIEELIQIFFESIRRLNLIHLVMDKENDDYQNTKIDIRSFSEDPKTKNMTVIEILEIAKKQNHLSKIRRKEWNEHLEGVFGSFENANYEYVEPETPENGCTLGIFITKEYPFYLLDD